MGTKISQLPLLSSITGAESAPVVDPVSGNTVKATVNSLGRPFVKGFTVDGNGIPIATGSKVKFQIPCNCSVVQWTIIAEDGTTGSVTLDLKTGPRTVWNTSLTSFVASNGPSMSSSTLNKSTNTTGWSNNLVAGNYLEIVINSISGGITKLTVELKLQPN
jgi:hypothetical protein